MTERKRVPLEPTEEEIVAVLDGEFWSCVNDEQCTKKFNAPRSGCFDCRQHYLDSRTAMLAAAPEPPDDACEWYQAEPDANCWSSSCGQDFQFNDGGPLENRCKFCHFCGKTLVEKFWTEEDEDEPK